MQRRAGAMQDYLVVVDCLYMSLARGAGRAVRGKGKNIGVRLLVDGGGELALFRRFGSG